MLFDAALGTDAAWRVHVMILCQVPQTILNQILAQNMLHSVTVRTFLLNFDYTCSYHHFESLIVPSVMPVKAEFPHNVD